MEHDYSEEAEKRARKIVARNLLRFMKNHETLTNANRLSVQTGISASTIKRIFEEEGGLSIDTLTRLADALGVQPFHLLVPGVDPFNLPLMPEMHEDDQREPTDFDMLQSPEMMRWLGKKPALKASSS